MQKRILGRTDINASEIALGGSRLTQLSWKESVNFINRAVETGINLIDTSTDYGNSEERIGDTFLIPKTNRTVHFSTRTAVDTSAETYAKVEYSLSRLKSKPIAIYGISVADEAALEQALGRGGALAGLVKAKNSKRIRYLALHTENIAVAKRVLNEVVFDIIVVPFSFMNQAFLSCGFIKAAQAKKLGILALEPFGSEGVYEPELGFKFLAQYPAVHPVFDTNSADELARMDKFLDKKEYELTEEDKTRIKQLKKADPVDGISEAVGTRPLADGELEGQQADPAPVLESPVEEVKPEPPESLPAAEPDSGSDTTRS